MLVSTSTAGARESTLGLAGISSASRSTWRMSSPTITLGIDLASKPAKTALCAIEWGDGEGVVRVLSRGRHDDTELHDKFLITAIRGLRFDFGGVQIEKTAIDAPFGWPEPFLDAVIAHQRGDG